jgi:hypothetical protein
MSEQFDTSIGVASSRIDERGNTITDPASKLTHIPSESKQVRSTELPTDQIVDSDSNNENHRLHTNTESISNAKTQKRINAIKRLRRNLHHFMLFEITGFCTSLIWIMP